MSEQEINWRECGSELTDTMITRVWDNENLGVGKVKRTRWNSISGEVFSESVRYFRLDEPRREYATPPLPQRSEER